MPAITPNLEFKNVSREWRCKFDPSEDISESSSLIALQEALNKILPSLKTVEGIVSVHRIVCAECFDFKVIVALDEVSFAHWEADDEAGLPKIEKTFMEELNNIEGVSRIEAQTFTLAEL
jgi:hypothetical protein